jgi:hypothetical protein
MPAGCDTSFGVNYTDVIVVRVGDHCLEMSDTVLAWTIIVALGAIVVGATLFFLTILLAVLRAGWGKDP